MHGGTCLAEGKVADAITAFPRARGPAALPLAPPAAAV
jgi:hypothetical protein